MSAEEWMDEQRSEMELSWEELAARAQISPMTLRRARRGERIQSLQARRLANALGWTFGSIADVNKGKPPTRKSERSAGSHSFPSPEPFPEFHSEQEQEFWRYLGDDLGITEYDSKLLFLQLYRREHSRDAEATGT